MVENRIQRRWTTIVVSNVMESKTFQRRVKIQRRGKGSTFKDGVYVSNIFESSQTETFLT